MHYFPTQYRKKYFLWIIKNIIILSLLKIEKIILLHGEDEDILLNEIGEEILEVENWNIGIVDDEDRTKIVHEVVGILYKKLQQEVSVLSSRNLIETYYFFIETCIICTHKFNNIHYSCNINCISTLPFAIFS